MPREAVLAGIRQVLWDDPVVRYAGAARRCSLCARVYGVSRIGLHLVVVTMRRLASLSGV